MKNRLSGPLRLCLFALLACPAPGAFSADKPPGYAVASAHPLATGAGIEVLQAGGNAFDAAVAVSAALAVVEPTSSGIGGGGFWLLHRASDGLETMVDGREVAPGAAFGDMYLDRDGQPVPALSRDGPLAAGIPGEPAALVHLAKLYAKLPLQRLLAPAIRLARDGFPLDEKLARALQAHRKRLSGAARTVFLTADGSVPAVGSLIRQPDLAWTLEQIAARGHAGFYEGEVARRLIAAVHKDGGIWTADDLRSYRVKERAPIAFGYRGCRIVTAPPPSAGGVGLAEMLQILQALHGSQAGLVEAHHLAVEAMRRAYHDRAAYLGDPDFVKMPLARLLSPGYAARMALGISPNTATPSSDLPGTVAQAAEGGQTTHFSVIDADGNRVAGTLSVNLSFGSGYMAPGTGVLLNDEMDDFSAKPLAPNAYGLVGSLANAVAPGKRMLSSMTPTFVERPDGGVLVLGTPGGSRIVTMVLLGILGYTQGLDAEQIVRLPRYHHQYLPDEIQYEPGALPAAVAAGLAARSHTLHELTYRYGNMNVVLWDRAHDRLEAVSDPRGIGAGRVVLTQPASEIPRAAARAPAAAEAH